MDVAMTGFVYILECDAMPGLVKVGMTERHPRERADELTAGTGIPSPFRLVRAFPVVDARKAEEVSHEVLRPTRYSENREFFRTSLLHATAMVEVILEQEGLLDEPLCVDRKEMRERCERDTEELARLREFIDADEHQKVAQILQLQTELEKLKTENDALRAKLPKAGQIETLESTIKEMEARRKESYADNAELRAEISRLRDRVAAMLPKAGLTETLESIINDMGAKQKESDAENKKLSEENGWLRDRVAAMSKIVEHHKVP
jgi:regulator of replication initiation timing